MKLFEASHIHEIFQAAFKIRQTKRATYVLSTFAAMLSAWSGCSCRSWTDPRSVAAATYGVT